MASMTYNDVELSIDLMDADVVERFENAVRECAEGVSDKSQYEGKTTAQCMRIQCARIDKFFDDAFGDGTAANLFGGRANLREHMDAFGMANTLGEQISAEAYGLLDKYTSNRVNRPESGKQRKPRYNNESYYHGKRRRDV